MGSSSVLHTLDRSKENKKMKYVVSGLIAAVGVLAFTASGASAAVVCNEGDCWKVKDTYEYPPEVRLHVYDDDWKWEGDKYHWRDPGAGRGYYRGGVWIGF
jgi:hypothetical protein